MWPFLSARMRGTLPAATWRYLVAAPGATVLAAVKQWPKQLHAELPAYPERYIGSPAEEVKSYPEFARCPVTERPLADPLARTSRMGSRMAPGASLQRPRAR